MIGNTVKDGSGVDYWIVVNSQGQLVTVPAWAINLTSEETLNDSDKTFTVPASTEWKIESIWIEFVSTATAGTRQIEIQILDGSSDVIMKFYAGATQSVSITRNYLFAPGAEALTAFRDTDFISTPIPEVILPATYGIRVFDNSVSDAAADDMVVHLRYASRTV